ncbi:MAG: sulfatase-like hydrolase/transferase [Polyangiaceae bacterium]
MKRLLFAVAGGVTAATLVGLVEARVAWLAGTGASAPSYGSLVAADVAVLAPLALLVSIAVGVLAIFLEPGRAVPPGEHLANLRAQPVLMRSRTAALAPLGIFVAFFWCLGCAHLARNLLSTGKPFGAGVELALGALALLIALTACGLALLPPLRKALARGAAQSPRLVDPVLTGGAAFAVVVVLLAWGMCAGDSGGEGGGVLGIFAVLKRTELDLRPVIDLVAMATGAYAAPVAAAEDNRSGARPLLIALVLLVTPLGITLREASVLNHESNVARAIERNAPLGKVALALLRKATDRDHDGASAFFGGGDCDDHDRLRSPLAIDVPGNGIDEDCSGGDLPAPAPIKVVPPPVVRPRAAPPDMNLILITIDTLRTDVGFMGYEKPTTPNLDKLAAKAAIFDHAYAMASYTGKSLGPMLIGKYPSETLRNSSHFNTYDPPNTFIAERFKKQGLRTFGGASHWYFNGWSGLTQGIMDWDLSAKPPSGQGDTDNSTTSKELTDAALRLLAKPENTSGRFFMWMHYFDPHAQYLPHEGAPNFMSGTSAIEASKAAYDTEVWFTDQQLGRLLEKIESEPWGKNTAIVITADHGEAFADHTMSFHGGELWESLVHVPLVIYIPGAEPRHIPVKRSHIDLVPTLLEMMGFPVPDSSEVSGVSMLSDILAAPTAELEERDIYFDMPASPYSGMRRGLIHGKTPGMKLIHLGGNNYNLFDLAADPGEREDLAGDRSKFTPVYAAFQEQRARLKEVEPRADPTDLPQ